jgi:hypothetical protein
MSFLNLGDDTSHRIERQGDVSIILFNGQDKTILDVLNVRGLMKKLLFVKKLDEVGVEMKYRRHILISLTIIVNYMPKNEFYELHAIAQNHVEMLLPYQQQFTCIRQTYHTSTLGLINHA